MANPPDELCDRSTVFAEGEEAKPACTIAEYEHIRKLLRDLDAQADVADQQPIEIEPTLPEDCTYPGDTPLP